MFLTTDNTPASAPGGHVWDHPGHVVEVADELGHELLNIAGAAFREILPGHPDHPGTAALEAEAKAALEAEAKAAAERVAAEAEAAAKAEAEKLAADAAAEAAKVAKPGPAK